MYHMICMMPRLSRRTKVTTAIVTTIGASPLLSIVGKVFAQVILLCIQSCMQVYPEIQSTFRAGRYTVDMIFSLHQLQEKY